MKLDWDKGNGLIPAIIQDSKTLQVLMLGYMSKESLEKTQATGKVTFFSRSKQRLWTKGETSGNFLNVVSLAKDCDGDTLLIKARPEGPTCHLGNISCFGNKDSEGLGFLGKLEQIIEDRFDNPKEESYTSDLFQKGINRIAQKVGEEATEVVIAATSEKEQFEEEVADLLFHLLVLIKAKGAKLSDITRVLSNRNKIK